MTEPSVPSRPPVVLIATQMEWSARSLESILAPNGYAVLRAHSGREAVEMARRAPLDAMLMEIRLPDADAVDVCRALSEEADWSPTAPIIVLAAEGTRVQRLAAYRAGAWEVVTQPLDTETLLLKLSRYIASKREADLAREESLVDPETGLYSSRGLALRAREIGAAAQRRHEPLACVAVSIDRRNGGNRNRLVSASTTAVPAHFGGIMRRVGRLSDAVGRLGPSEFAIVAPATDAAGAMVLAQRVQAETELSSIPGEGSEGRLTIRAGYCAVPDFSMSPIDPVEMLMRAASALTHLRGAPSRLSIVAYEDTQLNVAS